jgi:glycolate oxidase
MSAIVETVPVDLARQREVAAALRAFLPESSVLFEKEDVKPYECDGLSAYRQVPMVVALPETEEQVQRILKTCYEMRVPVVARGAGTGLSGGALPLGNGVLLSVAKLMRILDIDKASRTARVQPGVRNLAISEAAAPFGLYYAPDPSSQIACSIGGNVAENAGGMHCLKYGLTVHNILRLRAVTIDGELLEIGGEGLDAAGYDLLALMTGSEGMLAVITEVSVRLLPKPERAQCVLAAFDDVAKAGQAVANIIAAGLLPAGLEMMDRITTGAVEPFVNAGYPLDAEAILLCEADGNDAEVTEDVERMKAVLQASGASEIRVSQSEPERARFWAGRKAAFPAAGRVSPEA